MKRRPQSPNDLLLDVLELVEKHRSAELQAIERLSKRLALASPDTGPSKRMVVQLAKNSRKRHLAMLEQMKRGDTDFKLDAFLQDHGVVRSVFFDWKAGRLTGKVSLVNQRRIEEAIERVYRRYFGWNATRAHGLWQNKD